MRLLTIIDMQNDFITGSLKNEDARFIVPGICGLIGKLDDEDRIVTTQDTHEISYLSTREGKKLPIEHCIRGTAGWCVADQIVKTVKKRDERLNCVSGELEKDSFGCKDLIGYIDEYPTFFDEIVVVGTCTDICVITNALLLKTHFPETRIVVLSDLCAGSSKANHEAALKVMQSCQIDVVDSKTYLKEIEK